MISITSNKFIYVCFILSLCFLFMISYFAYPAIMNYYYIRKGAKEIDQRDFISAINTLSKNITISPNKYTAHYLLAEAIRKRLFYARYKELSPEKESSLIRKGEEAYKKALKLEPNSNEARIGLAKLYLFSSKYSEALYQFKIAALNSDNHEIYKYIGQIYIELNKPDIAKKYFLCAKQGKAPKSIKSQQQSNLVECIKANNKKYFIDLQLKWIINDFNLFNNLLGDLTLAKSIVSDIYFGVLVTNIKLYSNHLLHKNINKIVLQSINVANKDNLIKYGVSITEVHINKITSID